MKGDYLEVIMWRSSVLVALLLLSAYYVVQLGPFVGGKWDDGLYPILGKALATGQGYRMISAPGAPFEAGHPPLYPAILAVAWMIFPIFPANVWALKGINVLFSLASVVLAYFFVRKGRGGTRGQGVALAALIGLGSVIGGFVDVTMSEVLYLAASLLALLAAERVLVRGQPAGKRALAGLALATALPILVRSVGLVLPLAVAGWLALERRWRELGIYLAWVLAALAPWQLWSGWVVRCGQPVYFHYMGFMAEATGERGLLAVLLSTLPANAAEILFSAVPVVLVPAWPMLAERWHLGLVAPLAVAVCAVGLALAMRGGVRAFHLYLAGYLALVAVFPWPPMRYVGALAPVLAYGLVEGLWALARLGWPGRVVAAGLLAASLTWGALDVRTALRRPWPPPAWQAEQALDDRSYVGVIRRLVERTPPDAVVLSETELETYLYTGRQTLPCHLAGDDPAKQLAQGVRQAGGRPLYMLVPGPVVDRARRLVPGWELVAAAQPGGYALFKAPYFPPKSL
jgi:hypothetical protein